MGDFAERQRSIALKETIFRAANEELGPESEPVLDARGGLTSYMCECGDADCARNISMSLEEYETIRSDPRRFLIVPGHEIADVEEVVEEHPRYWVVQKPDEGPAGEIVRSTDRRRRD